MCDAGVNLSVRSVPAAQDRVLVKLTASEGMESSRRLGRGSICRRLPWAGEMDVSVREWEACRIRYDAHHKVRLCEEA